MRKKKFLRRNVREYSKLGKLRKKLQKWRKPKGRDNKMRLKERGRPSVVKVGYKQSEKTRHKIEDKKQIVISKISDLNKLDGKEIAVLGRMGKKKKLEVAKVAKEKGIKFVGFNPKKFLEENSKEKPKTNEGKK